MVKAVGIVGARGYVGAELIRMVARHPRMRLAFVSSREREGQRVADHVDNVDRGLRYSAPALDALPGLDVDALVLALPNGKAAACVAGFAGMSDAPVIVDLSADHRFDAQWHYGLPELTRGQRTLEPARISNPGCYATAMQLAIAPMRDVLAGPVQCFGVSGYSGAGSAPSDRNDTGKLRDNLMPYALSGHLHEREVAHRMGHPVEFMPHVAPHFRGLSVTVNLHLSREFGMDGVLERYHGRYATEPLVAISDEAPWVTSVAGQHHAAVGGFTLANDGCRVVVVAALDNLLKGAATQAMQNLNLAFGFDELAGIKTGS
jgi:N-acetyl-gamma-glutamyl-phosphate reductase common form